MNKTFTYYSHQNKGALYRKALLDDGWRQVEKSEHPVLILADADTTEMRQENLQKHHVQGARIFIYPHAARPAVHYDFKDYPQSRVVSGQFVTTEGHRKILEIIGYIGNLHAVGWSLCPLKPFKPVHIIQKIVFAPVHANGSGWLHDADKEVNRVAFEKAREYALGRKAHLMVRYLGHLEAIGLKKAPLVDYVQGAADQNFEHIDHADLIISTQTYQYLSVARGKPTIGMGESLSPKIGHNLESFRWADSWEKYKDLMAYPLDICSNVPVRDLVEAATDEDARITEWRRRLIGGYFDSREFLRVVNSHFLGV